MKIEKHIIDLIGLLKDIRKEPSPATVGFLYSTALVHMFYITFFEELDPGRAIKHEDFRSERNSSKLKTLIKDFLEKDEMFDLWKQMENKRNELCYGYSAEEDIKEYADNFLKIKEILECVSKKKFDIDFLDSWLKEEK